MGSSSDFAPVNDLLFYFVGEDVDRRNQTGFLEGSDQASSFVFLPRHIGSFEQGAKIFTLFDTGLSNNLLCDFDDCVFFEEPSPIEIGDRPRFPASLIESEFIYIGNHFNCYFPCSV